MLIVLLGSHHHCLAIVSSAGTVLFVSTLTILSLRFYARRVYLREHSVFVLRYTGADLTVVVDKRYRHLVAITVRLKSLRTYTLHRLIYPSGSLSCSLRNLVRKILLGQDARC